MDTLRICKQCRAPLPADAPQGLCPQCLIKVGLGSEAGNLPLTEPSSAKADRSEPLSSAEIAKHFPQLEILELLGQGGMGVVYKARQPKLDRFVALKILGAEYSRDAAFAERFQREAKALARLNHPNIVGVYDFGQSEGLFFLLMEYVDGANLRQMQEAHRFTPAEALGIIPKICDALQYAHDEGIVHRDIKPGNILVDKKGRVKIADFGLAKLVGKEATDPTLTAAGVVMGTPRYMAPEQMERPTEVDHRADIYSLGVVFYEMLTGELPMGRFDPPSRKVQVDVRLDEIVLRSLERDVERRYQHASEVKTDVESIASVSGTSEQSSKAVHGGITLRSQEWPVGTLILSGVVLIASFLPWLPYSTENAWTSWMRLSGTVIQNWWYVVVAAFVALLALLRAFGLFQTRYWIPISVVIGTLPLGYFLKIIRDERGGTAFGPILTLVAFAGIIISDWVHTKSLFRSATRSKPILPGGLSAGLLVVGASDIVLGIACIVWKFGPLFGPEICFVLFSTLGALKVLGAFMLGTCRSLHWARISAIVAMVPYPTPYYVASLPIGAWALLELNKQDVREAFGDRNLKKDRGNERETPPSPVPKAGLGLRILVWFAVIALTLVVAVVAATLILPAWVNYQKQRTAQQPIFYTFAGVTPFVRSPDGPVFGRSAITKMSLSSSQAVEVNKIIPRYYRDFMTLERQHTQTSKDLQGHVHIKISPFSEESFALADKLAGELRGIAGKDLFYPRLPGNLVGFGLFRHAGLGTVDAELWKEGDIYHFHEVLGPHDLPNDKSAGASRGNESRDRETAFPEEYLIYWNEGSSGAAGSAFTTSSGARVPLVYQIDGDTGFARGPDGLELREAAARNMKLGPSQLRKANQIFSKYSREYDSLVRQNTRTTNDAQGHLQITISPFRDTLVTLQEKMVVELRAVTGKDVLNPKEPDNIRPAEILNPSSPEDFPLFRHRGVTKVGVEFWKEGDVYHISETRDPYTFHYRNISGTTSYGKSGYNTTGKEWKKILPEEYWSLWTESKSVVSNAVELAAAEILEKMENKYASLSTFSATGKTVTEMSAMGVDAPVTNECVYALKLARPDYYLIEWTNKMNLAFANLEMKGAVWYSGKDHFLLLPGGKASKMINREQAFSLATGPSGGAANTVPSLFLKDNASEWFNALTNLSKLPDGKVDNDDCHVLSADGLAGKTTIWIRKKDFLLRQIRDESGPSVETALLEAASETSDASLKKILKLTGQEATAETAAELRNQIVRSGKLADRVQVTSTQTFQNIAVDELMEKDDFEHQIPTDAAIPAKGNSPAAAGTAPVPQKTEQSGGRDEILFTANGPVMNEALIQTLDLKPLEVREADRIMQEIRRDYDALETKHLTTTNDSQGHLHVSFVAFPTEWSGLRDRFLKSLEPVLEPRNYALAARHFPFNQLMPYGSLPIRVELWRDTNSGRYCYQGKPIPEIGVLKGGKGSNLSALPAEYQYFWQRAQAQSGAPAVERP